jgi:hypothetical protein
MELRRAVGSASICENLRIASALPGSAEEGKKGTSPRCQERASWLPPKLSPLQQHVTLDVAREAVNACPIATR